MGLSCLCLASDLPQMSGWEQLSFTQAGDGVGPPQTSSTCWLVGEFLFPSSVVWLGMGGMAEGAGRGQCIPIGVGAKSPVSQAHGDERGKPHLLSSQPGGRGDVKLILLTWK